MAASAVLLRLSSSEHYTTSLSGVLFNRQLHAEVAFAKCRRGRILNRKLFETILCQKNKESSDELKVSDHKHDCLVNRSWSEYGVENEDVTSSTHNVDCHVEAISWRERRITASIAIDASLHVVWQVLTDYEQLSDFIPNLVHSVIIPCPYPGRLWLLQKGVQRMMYWNIEAHVILDLKEFPTVGELHFFMVDGDFVRYDGKWCLQVGPRLDSSILRYEVNVVPKIIFPATLIENIIKADLPKNLCAIAKRAEAKVDCKSSNLPNIHTSIQAGQAKFEIQSNRSFSLGAAGLQWSGLGRTCKLNNECIVDEIHFRRLDDLLENGGVHRQVVASITVKASSKDVWRVLTAYETLPEFVPNLVNSTVLSRDGNSVRLMQEGCKCLLYMVLHARVVLDLWEQPDQKISFKQVEGDFDSFQGTWTLSQLGGEHTVLKYAVDAKICKDCILAESLVEEVVYEDLPSNLCAVCDRVESLVNGSSSASVEIYNSADSLEPAVSSISSKFNLIESEYVDSHSKIQDDNDANNPSLKPINRRRTRIKGLRKDFHVLEREIRNFITFHGSDGIMPKRKLLRMHGRFDIDKAITAAGGFRSVAARMKLSLSYDQRKPAGYWDDINNLWTEVIAAQKQLGCDPAVLPSRLSVERLGNFSLSRTFEKWGGAKEMARILGLLPKGSKRPKHYWSQQLANEPEFICDVKPYDIVWPQELGNEIILAPNVKPFHTGVPQESAKWLTLVAESEETIVVQHNLDDVEPD